MVCEAARPLLQRAVSEFVAVSLSNSPPPPPLTPPSPQYHEPNHSSCMSAMSFMRCGESCYTLHLCEGVAAVVDAVSLAEQPFTPATHNINTSLVDRPTPTALSAMSFMRWRKSCYVLPYLQEALLTSKTW